MRIKATDVTITLHFDYSKVSYLLGYTSVGNTELIGGRVYYNFLPERIMSIQTWLYCV